MGDSSLNLLLSRAASGATLPELLRGIGLLVRPCGVGFTALRFFHATQPALILSYTSGRRIPALRPGLREPADSENLCPAPYDLTHAPPERPYLRALAGAGFTRFLSVPLRTAAHTLGTLDFAAEAPRTFRQLDADWIQAAAALISLVHEHGQLVGRTTSDREVKSRLRQENIQLREVSARATPLPELLGESPVWLRLIRQIEQVAPSDSTIFIRGETGTGKELVARALHRLSKRATKPFVAVNCGAFSRELISSELFGHERGAFTGAIERRLGRLCLAQGGTLFLDEVAELAPDIQVRLLRVLQEREYERVGGTQTLRADVRILAATHRDMEAERAAGRFRDDLYYRLNVVPLFVPALRERRSDIELLVHHFLSRAELKTGKSFNTFDAAALAACEAYDWPGNVRELENLVERAALLSEPPIIALDPFADTAGRARHTTAQTLDAVTATHIRATLHRTHGKVYGVDGAAARLGLKPSTLQAKMRKLGIPRIGP